MSAPQFVTLAQSIAALTITNGGKTLTILEFGETPDSIDLRTCPVMFVDPETTITNFTTTRTGMGPGTGDVHGYAYTLNYYAAIAPVGSGRGIAEAAEECAEWAQVITNAIAEADDTLIASNNVTADVSAIGIITDPTGGVYHGLRIGVRVEEF